ncbi:hypothetical protein ABKN59_012030 [Abortiporus biennis]
MIARHVLQWFSDTTYSTHYQGCPLISHRNSYSSSESALAPSEASLPPSSKSERRTIEQFSAVGTSSEENTRLEILGSQLDKYPSNKLKVFCRPYDLDE